MFNKERYESAIDKSGYRKRYISDSLGLAYDTFVKKGNGIVEWKLSEIEGLCRILNLTKADMYSIFFS